MLGEPWNTLLFLLIIPAFIQLYKMYKDKGGSPLSKLSLQIISFVLAGVFTYLNGGLIGLPWPILPVWTGDFVGFVGIVLTYAGDLVAVVVVAFGTMQALYELVLKRLFETVGFAVAEKVASRKEVGFWA